MPRPTKYTFRTVRRLLRHLQEGGSKKSACGAAGINRETLRRWTESNAAFAARIKRAMLKGESSLVDTVLTVKQYGAIPQRLTAAMFLLNTVHGYRQTKEVKHTGKVQHEHTNKQLEEAWERLNQLERQTMLKALSDGNGDGAKGLRLREDKKLGSVEH